MDPVERQAKILEHYPLVRAIAGRMVRRFPSNIELDELVNVGVIGLIDALERFDPSRGVPFKAFAEIRIRGQIVDALRYADHVPRSVRRKSARIEAARSTLRRALGREPSRDEMAHSLDITVEAYDSMLSDAEIRRLISMETLLDEESGTTIGEQVPSGDASVEDEWQRTEMTDELRAALDRLPDRERKVVIEFYYEERPLLAIGKDLGVSESRVSQIRKDGVKRLQAWLKMGRIPRAKRPDDD